MGNTVEDKEKQIRELELQVLEKRAELMDLRIKRFSLWWRVELKKLEAM